MNWILLCGMALDKCNLLILFFQINLFSAECNSGALCTSSLQGTVQPFVTHDYNVIAQVFNPCTLEAEARASL